MIPVSGNDGSGGGRRAPPQDSPLAPFCFRQKRLPDCTGGSLANELGPQAPVLLGHSLPFHATREPGLAPAWQHLPKQQHPKAIFAKRHQFGYLRKHLL